MLTSLTDVPLSVLDQDQALGLYVGTLGLDVPTDADVGPVRWLTVRVPGESGREVLLERPGPSTMDATTEQGRDLAPRSPAGPVSQHR